MTKVKMNLNLKKYNDIHVSSIINAPILKDQKVVGMITNYNIDTDEATGFLFDDISFNLNENKSICSIEIIQDKYKNN